MHRIEETEIYCPYCGEQITVLIDGSVPGQRYTEDCEVCCRPIVLSYEITEDDEVQVYVQREDD